MRELDTRLYSRITIGSRHRGSCRRCRLQAIAAPKRYPQVSGLGFGDSKGRMTGRSAYGLEHRGNYRTLLPLFAIDAYVVRLLAKAAT
jgi:hypothetical protein